MEWVTLSASKKVAYNNDKKTITISFQRENNPPLKLQFSYGSILILHQLYNEFTGEKIRLQDSNNEIMKRIAVEDGFRYVKTTLYGDEIWTSPSFSIDEMVSLLVFIKSVEVPNFDGFTVLYTLVIGEM